MTESLPEESFMDAVMICLPFAEVISIYYGSDASEEKAEALAAVLEEKYPDCEVEVNNGGQPIYYYIISVE